jgi:hypothetical protein
METTHDDERRRGMTARSLDADTAESVAGVVRLLWRASVLVWARADVQGPRSSLQLLALAIDATADEARSLLPVTVAVDGPVPVGDDPAGLLRSAEQLLRHLSLAGVPPALDDLRAQVVELVWEANTGADA